MLVLLVLFTIFCLAYALVKKRFIALTFPVGALIVLVIVKVVMIPLPLMETIQFIFDLR